MAIIGRGSIAYRAEQVTKNHHQKTTQFSVNELILQNCYSICVYTG